MKIRLPSNDTPKHDPKELWRHFSATYFSLRMGLALLALAFPFVLYAYGKLGHGLDLQPSMSAYYWAATADQCAAFPMRTIFVGFLVAIGVGLYAYKGFTPLENVLLNVAGVCAALIAIFPERITVGAKQNPRIEELFRNCPAVEAWAKQPAVPIHFPAAIMLFVLLAIVAWACAEKTLEFAPETVDDVWFRRRYKAFAIAMILFPLPGVAVAYALGLGTHWVFFVEAAGILTFGFYWLLKTHELRLSKLEEEAQQAVDNARARQKRKAQGAAVGQGVAAAPTAALPGAALPPTDERAKTTGN